MGRIPTYNPDPQLPVANRTAEQFGAGVGRAVGELGGTVQRVAHEIDDFRTQKEVSQAAVALTEAQADLASEWEETLRTGDPHDENLASDFMTNRVQARIDEMSGKATTGRAKRRFAEQSAGLTASFAKTTAAGAANLAGEAAVADFKTSLNNLSSAALIDPGSVPDLLVQSDELLANMVEFEKMSTSQLLKLKGDAREEIAVSAVQGAMERNPASVEALLRQGVFSDNISGPVRKRLIDQAEAMATANTTQATKFSRDQAALAAGEIINGLIDKNGQFVDPTSEMISSLENDPRFQTPEGAAAKISTAKYLRGLQTKSAVVLRSENSTLREFNKRLGIPIGQEGRLTPNEIDFAMTEGKLTRQDRDSYMQSVDMASTPQGSAQVDDVNTIIGSLESSITASNAVSGILDGPGDQRFGTFETTALAAYHSAREDGVTHKELTDRSSPNYIGNLATQFLMTAKQSQAEELPALQEGVTVITDPVTGLDRLAPTDAPEPRAPGASVSDMEKFLKEN